MPTQRLAQGDTVGRSFQDLANRRWTMAGMDYPSPLPVPGTTLGGYSIPGVDGNNVWNMFALPEDVYPAFQIYDTGRTYTYNWSYYSRFGAVVILSEGTTTGNYGVIVDDFQLHDQFCAQTFDELTEMGAWNWSTVFISETSSAFNEVITQSPVYAIVQHWSPILVHWYVGTTIYWAGVSWTSFWPLEVFTQDTGYKRLDVVSGLESVDSRLLAYLAAGCATPPQSASGQNNQRNYVSTLGSNTSVSERYATQDATLYDSDGVNRDITGYTPYWVGMFADTPVFNIADIPPANFRNTAFMANDIYEPGTTTVLQSTFLYDDIVGKNISIRGSIDEYFNSVVAANDYPGDSPDPAKSYGGYEEVVFYVVRNGYEMYTTYDSPVRLHTEAHLKYTAHIGSQSWELDWPENMQLWNSNILIYDHGRYITFSWLLHTNDYDWFGGYGYQGACLFVKEGGAYTMTMRYHNVVDNAAMFTVPENGAQATYHYFAYYQPDLKMITNPRHPTS